MQRLIFVYPGDLNAPTGGYAYDRRIIQGLEDLGWQIQLIGLGEGYPFPDRAQIEYASGALQNLPIGVPVVIDGLALGALPDLAAEIAKRQPLLALVHHPLAFEFGLSDSEIQLLKQSEIQALQQVVRVIAVSPTTARDLHQHYGVPIRIIEVVLPGTDRIHSPESRIQKNEDRLGPVHLLSVGSIIPRKGFHDLIAALMPLVDLPWTLSIAGDTSRNAETYQRLMTDIKRFHLEDRIEVLGAVANAELENLYARADLFVLPSLFEGYGMVYAEAMAYGLPIIATTAGAIPDTVPQEAGLLVHPGDIPALTRALKALIQDPSHRARLSSGALRAAGQQPTWENAVQQFASVLTSLSPS
jgi:glycosyltransferase involved in cell wall biosynthesis